MAERDAELVRLVSELNEAESQNLDDEGPILTRFHRAVVALCDYVGIPNKWNLSIDEDRAAHPERYRWMDETRDIPER